MNDHSLHQSAKSAVCVEHLGGAPAPASGTYEQLNVFGRPTGHRVTAEEGELLPVLPRGFTWRAVSGE